MKNDREIRSNPDVILKKIKTEEEAQAVGHLKIFFGYAAGVGKTYCMLEDAHAAKARGIDVVVGYIEPHTRPDTIALLGGLEQLPNLKLEHRGILVKELDLDAAIKRKPQLILVDELAHTNAQGCRHTKRYKDVEELLKAGIDVYTTINVQHIESLNDMVAAITGISVRERIPDHIFDKAAQVELLDLEPEELIDRLNAGKIYKETQAQKALGNFFKVKNLTALREIALRRCADRVNRVSESERISHNSDYYTEEHFLICLSASPSNAKIIRTAARMAKAFQGRFTGLFVETPNLSFMSEENKKRLRSNIRLAEQLGATIETVYGDDIALQISEFARISGVSKLVMGRDSARRKYFWSKPSLNEKLANYSPNLDVYIIPDKNAKKYKGKNKDKSKFKLSIPEIIKCFGMLSLCTIIGFAFFELGFSESNIIIVYILGILVTAILTSQRMYCLISSIASVLTFNYFFTDPRFTLHAKDPGYPATFVIMFIAAFITGTLAVKIKQHAKQSTETAYRTKLLLETNQLLQKGKERLEITAIAANQLIKLLQKDIVFYINQDGILSEPLVYKFDANEVAEDYTNENEKAVATWVFKNNRHAGATTNTLGSAKCRYLAVRVNDAVYGVVGVALKGDPMNSFENSIMLSILGECALALENQKATKERQEIAILAKNEQLRANLLRSISHDLRTPLTSVLGNAGILLSNGESMPENKKKKLYQDIYDDSYWLIDLVENLLSITRIEDGSMIIKTSMELMDEVINEALNHIKRKNFEQKIIFTQSDEFILAKMDARLIMQVIVNIVDNAIKYTPNNSEIHISTQKSENKVIVDIVDNGRGIEDKDKEKLFDMFYTAGTEVADSRRSLGLGLALCKSIINAHGGELFVFDNTPSGTILRFTLQAEEVTLNE